ncbi:UNVERIFIED_CONTAM: hypothetical protein FKN15_048975 [Acipenser sinensis]
MGRKSCKKQQKRRQQQQLPPGDVGPRYVVDEWCPGCGEFGHMVAICSTQYQEEEVEPQPQEEDGWEALLRSMGVPYCCFICGEVGHFPANCPLPPVRDLLCPPTPAEGAARRGGAPAAFAARRGGAPAAFAARRGGAPAAFSTFTTFTCTTTFTTFITTAFTTPTSTRRGAKATSTSSPTNRGRMPVGLATFNTITTTFTTFITTAFTTPTSTRRGARATSTSSPTNRGRMPVGLTTFTFITTAFTTPTWSRASGAASVSTTTQGCQPHTAQGCQLRIAWGCLSLRIAWDCFLFPTGHRLLSLCFFAVGPDSGCPRSCKVLGWTRGTSCLQSRNAGLSEQREEKVARLDVWVPWVEVVGSSLGLSAWGPSPCDQAARDSCLWQDKAGMQAGVLGRTGALVPHMQAVDALGNRHVPLAPS